MNLRLFRRSVGGRCRPRGRQGTFTSASEVSGTHRGGRPWKRRSPRFQSLRSRIPVHDYRAIRLRRNTLRNNRVRCARAPLRHCLRLPHQTPFAEYRPAFRSRRLIGRCLHAGSTTLPRAVLCSCSAPPGAGAVLHGFGRACPRRQIRIHPLSHEQLPEAAGWNVGQRPGCLVRARRSRRSHS